MCQAQPHNPNLITRLKIQGLVALEHLLLSPICDRIYGLDLVNAGGCYPAHPLGFRAAGVEFRVWGLYAARVLICLLVSVSQECPTQTGVACELLGKPYVEVPEINLPSNSSFCCPQLETG